MAASEHPEAESDEPAGSQALIAVVAGPEVVSSPAALHAPPRALHIADNLAGHLDAGTGHQVIIGEVAVARLAALSL
jgi:hypothetical protein